MSAAILLLAAIAQATPLDGFEAPGAWQAAASDGVASRVATIPAEHGHALRLDYDFRHVSGYAYARRTLPVRFPANFVVTLRLRGSGGVNDLQLKFVDASGANVWWYQRRNFRPSADWQTIRIRPQDLTFAWGPATDHALTHTAAVELVLVRGRDGGAGHLDVDDLALTVLPPPAPLPPPKASDPAALDGRRDTAWTTNGGGTLTLDFGGNRPLGGALLHWHGAAPRYTVEASDDARRWHTARTVTQGDGSDDPIALPDLETRYLRIVLPPGAPPAALAEVQVEPPEWGATPNALIAALAATAPRGSYPRGFSGEQPYWTLVASDVGGPSGLIGEDGAIEVAKGGFSIEPFVVADGRRFDWANVTAQPSLERGYLPIPHVGWAGPGWRLDTSVFADTSAPRLMARWRVTNTAAVRRTIRLVLAVRPFQVNPPAQFLSQQGGVSAISRIVWTDGRLAVTTPPAIAGDPAVTRVLLPLGPPTRVIAAGFDQGALADPTRLSGGASVDDPTALASAALDYALDLAPGASAEVAMAIPFDAAATAAPDRAAFDRAHDATIATWQATLDRVAITVPTAKQPVADTVRTALAHILMSRDGAALKPGTRSYDRSWIRDGSMIADTLLRLGVDRPAVAFGDWYAGQLFADGKVPCCVDFRGPDPVPENDAQGEFIYLQTQLYRYTGDRARLARVWPRIEAARRYMEAQRQSERTAANLAPDRRMLYGLMPPSISHEGYSAQPQYSLWDDFWSLTGYRDAAAAAQALGRPEAPAIAAQRDQFAADLRAAITASAAHWHIPFIPGATSLGDWDATSTTIALDPAGAEDLLDPTLLADTFDRQWRRVQDRLRPGATWEDYTPYELRNVSAFVRLGWRTRANALLAAYMADRRPPAWNGWAEVVGRDPRKIRFIGDMPHAWVASDFIRAALDLFAYVRARDQAIILAGGLDASWLSGPGSAIRCLRTPYGTLDLAIRSDRRGLTATIAGDARPPGGFVLPWPLAGRPGTATIDGHPASIATDGLHIRPTGRAIVVLFGAR